MLSEQADEDDPGIPSSPSKRRSMLAKTMQAIGKVKPMFKKGSKKNQMELFNSCDSLDFDISEIEDRAHETESDEEDTENSSESADILVPVQPIHEPPSSQEPDLEDSKDEVEAAAPKAANPTTPEPKEHKTHKPKKTRSTKETDSPRKRLSPKPSPMRSPTSKLQSRREPQEESENDASNRRSQRGVASRRLSLDLVVKEIDEKDKENRKNDAKKESEDSLARLSLVVGDNDGMGGYLSKLQSIKTNAASKPHEQSDSAAVELRGVDETKGEKSNGSSSKAKKVKKLLGMSRSSPRTTKNTVKEPIPSPNDEEHQLMMQLTTMLSPKIDERPTRKESRLSQALASRKSNAADDYVDDDEESEAFPEIPTEKKTSLSEIRRMMESTKKNEKQAQIHISKPLSPKRHSGVKSKGSVKGDLSWSRTRSTSRSASKEKVLKSHSSTKSGQSPTSMTSSADSEKPRSQKTLASPPRPSSHRKSLQRPSKRRSTESTEAKTPQAVASRKQEDLNQRSSPNEMQSDATKQSRRRRNSSSPSEDTSPEETVRDAENELQQLLKRGPSKKSRDSQLERRSSRHAGKREDGTHRQGARSPHGAGDEAIRKSPGSFRSRRSSHQKETNHADDDAGRPTKEHDTLAASTKEEARGGTPTPSASPHSDTLRNNNDDFDGRLQFGRAASMIHMGKPPLGPMSAKSSNKHGLSRGLSERDISQDFHKQRGPVRGKSPSLAESLEKDASVKLRMNDGQHSVSTDGSELFVKGKICYRTIRSDESVGAPQLVLGAGCAEKPDLRVKNI